MGPWYVRTGLLAIGALALLFPRVRLAYETWILAAGMLAAALVVGWPLHDNHIYLLAYWCLAVALAVGAARPDVTLRESARRLVGLAFACAVVWKVLWSPDYLDGRFFKITLLTDDRFANATMLFGDLTRADLNANRQALEPLPAGAELLDPPAITQPPAFATLAAISTWGAVLLEGAVAAAFLFPVRAAIRHALLLTFCVVTYAVAPVAGFGWLLLIMGVAQADPRHGALHVAYVLAFFLVLAYSEVPWMGLLLERMQR